MLLNKMELKRQKDKLALYNKSLPSLKKKQSLLQKQIILMENEIKTLEEKIAGVRDEIDQWVAVFGDEINFPSLEITNISFLEMNIAGIDISVIEHVEQKADYSVYETPWWIDDAVAILKNIAELSLKIDNTRVNIEKINSELEVTNQRINLFEKRLIPESEENIRKIRIFLGDQQVAAVCRGKLTKSKNEKKEVAI